MYAHGSFISERKSDQDASISIGRRHENCSKVSEPVDSLWATGLLLLEVLI